MKITEAIESELLEWRNVELTVWTGADGAVVFQIDTTEDTGHIRVNVNDAPVFDQDPNEPSRIDYAALSREVV